MGVIELGQHVIDVIVASEYFTVAEKRGNQKLSNRRREDQTKTASYTG